MADNLFFTGVLLVIFTMAASIAISFIRLEFYLSEKPLGLLWILPTLSGISAFVLFIMSIWSY